ncbi:MAG: integrase core domain-containing protein [Saprospiraceae bacterium]|nr:integrase core domain-containing protein [Saprospiraceae bacterium]
MNNLVGLIIVLIRHPKTSLKKSNIGGLKKNWGAKKIRIKVLEKFIHQLVPSVTTIHNILIREGLVTPKKKRRNVKPSYPVFDPQWPNEIWSADYKGSFLLGNKKRCFPLTICDSRSRFIFDIQGQYNENTKNVMLVLKKVFKQYGMPKYFHTDNGSPFASIQSPSGYGYLSYWLLDHGVQPVFSDPGRPDQNGRHERMHKDLKARCCKPPALNLRSQNRRMNAFAKEYNQERPHEHLDMKTPAKVHQFSDKEWKDKILPIEYDPDFVVKKVTSSGAIRWGAYEWVNISRCLIGKYIGIKKLGNRIWQVFYRNYSLGYFKEGEQVQKGRYHLLDSDKDMNGRRRGDK